MGPLEEASLLSQNQGFQSSRASSCEEGWCKHQAQSDNGGSHSYQILGPKHVPHLEAPCLNATQAHTDALAVPLRGHFNNLTDQLLLGEVVCRRINGSSLYLHYYKEAPLIQSSITWDPMISATSPGHRQ